MQKMIESTVPEITWAKEIADFARAHDDENSAKMIDFLISEYAARKIRIAVVGLNKRGKSTFCNALLGRKDDVIAPIDWKPATGVISSFSYSSGAPHATVHFEDQRTADISYEQIRDYALESKNPENAKKVERIDVFGDFALDKDIELLDLPGDDSIHAYHSQIVYNYLPNADVVLFLSSATDPIDQSELTLLSRIKENDRRKIFFIINKADDCDEDELAEAKEHNAEVLKNAHFGANVGGEMVMPYQYCISAKQMMETGEEHFEFQNLATDIATFLNENKLNLMREGFKTAVRNVAAGLQGKMETYLAASQLSEQDIQNKLDTMKQGFSHSKEMLDHGLDEFSMSWNQMISTLEQKLPALEESARVRVKEYIAAIPMMTITDQKVLHALPQKIAETIQLVLEGPLAEVEEQVKSNLTKLDQNVKNISEYLMDNDVIVNHVGSANFSVSGALTGGAFIAAGAGLTSLATGATAAVGGVPLIGGFLSMVVGGATVPLTLLAAPLLAIGGLIAVCPVMGWIRGKQRQKNEIMESADNSVRRAFSNMRSSKIPLMRQQGEMLVIKLREAFKEKMEQYQEGIQKALDDKHHLLGSGSDANKVQADCEMLSDMLNDR